MMIDYDINYSDYISHHITLLRTANESTLHCIMSSHDMAWYISVHMIRIIDIIVYHHLKLF